MDYSDSELQGQIVLASLVVLTGAAFLLRAVIFLRHNPPGFGRCTRTAGRMINDAPSNRFDW